MTKYANVFDKIKGYKEIKEELLQICDIMNNYEVYKNLGVTMPKGLLLSGEPGLGKTLMASCLIEASGWDAFMCRKDKPDGEFVNSIKQCFEKAKDAAPSIVFLDDLDKFANEDRDHDDAEEYVAVQACIDDVKDKNVFVIATVNELWKLPDSLVRRGRFDRQIEVVVPYGKDAVEIVKAFLSERKFVDDVDPKIVARLLSGKSCADLETIINDAGVHAGYLRHDSISLDDIIHAFLKSSHGASFEMDQSYKESVQFKQTVCHEAGHAIVSEVLKPGSVTLVSVAGGSVTKGITCLCSDENSLRTIESIRNDIMVSLAGRAAVEIAYGVIDVGTSKDILDAADSAKLIVSKFASAGFSTARLTRYDDTETHNSHIEEAVITELESCYQKTKQIIVENKCFLNKICDSLIEKTTITENDIQQIRIAA